MLSLRVLSLAGRRALHTSMPLSVAIGDKIPSVELQKGNPKNKLNIAV